MVPFPNKNLSNEALSALVDASAAINASQGLDETLQAIASAATAVMQAEASSVIMLDKPRRKQVFHAAVGDRAERLIGIEFDMNVGLSGKAIATRKAQIYNHVAREKAHYKEIDVMLDFHTRSLIAAPLIHKGEVLGVVEVINPISSNQFTEADKQLAEVFANLAAIAAANARSYDRIKRENEGLKKTFTQSWRMIGKSPAMQEVFRLINRVCKSNATVLLLGESGVGKELAARVIHEKSPRADRPFIPVNCAALPETLLESELFGHEAGAFTGATSRRLGRFELANEGTIFLDEIGEIAPAVQVKLLRVLQEKEFVRVGGTKVISCDVRVIAASNRDLEAERREGKFRDDLYYRLNVFPIVIPPLRQRREDIPELVEYFIGEISAELKIPAPNLTNEAMAALTRYDWPGNIRELRNVLERACLLAEDRIIDLEHLPQGIVGQSDSSTQTKGQTVSTLQETEKALIIKALRESNGNQTKAARSLGITRDVLRYRIKKYNLSKLIAELSPRKE
ncbi:MAG: sigma-54-dependent Fis family transcriptional regulator [Planctomycetes bacterium]|nr:sigma-54-dependent Fis family transcriptional regulator [Planctomycetota bacterium]